MSILLIVLKVVASLAFALAGGFKLFGARPFVEQFKEFGLPLEMMYFIGILELAGAVGLWIGPLTLWTFSGLVCLMIGAISRHLKAKHPFSKVAPSVGLLIICVAGVILSWS